MREQVVGLFQREADVAEAARILHSAGYTLSDLDMVSKAEVSGPAPGWLTGQIHLGRLMERPEGMWPCGLRWALIGTLVVEVPVLIWVLLAFDSWGIQLFLGVTLWKFGTLFGGMLGATAGAFRGLESQVAHRYEEHLAQGSLALVARVHRRDAAQARAIFIESGAYDIRSVEGDFISREAYAGVEQVPQPQDNSRSQ